VLKSDTLETWPLPTHFRGPRLPGEKHAPAEVVPADPILTVPENSVKKLMLAGNMEPHKTPAGTVMTVVSIAALRSVDVKTTLKCRAQRAT
jgi:hypothetical protein